MKTIFTYSLHVILYFILFLKTENKKQHKKVLKLFFVFKNFSNMF